MGGFGKGGERKGCIISSDGVTRGEIPFGRHARRIEYNFNNNFQEKGWGAWTILF